MSFLSNPYRELQDIVSGPPLLIGDVIDITDNIATIEEPGGGISTARGTASIGDRVFFRGGVIEGQAPALPIENIDV